MVSTFDKKGYKLDGQIGPLPRIMPPRPPIILKGDCPRRTILNDIFEYTTSIIMFRLGYSKNYIPYIILIILDTLLTNVSVTNFADCEKSYAQTKFSSLMLDDEPY